jgi:hypothetical protein
LSETGASGERLREILLASTGEDRGEGCPDSALLWRGARGELPREELGTLVDHVATCGHCTETWRLAREMAVSSRRTEVPQTSTGWLRRPGARWAALAAAAVLVVAAGVVLFRPGPEPVSTHREAAEGEIRSLVPETLALPRSACLLRWTDLGEGALYGVSVATVGLEPLFTATSLEDSELLVPEPVLAGLPPGSTILWQVEASLGEGRHVVSRTFAQLIE